jgi:hypothetical protein
MHIGPPKQLELVAEVIDVFDPPLRARKLSNKAALDRMNLLNERLTSLVCARFSVAHDWEPMSPPNTHPSSYDQTRGFAGACTCHMYLTL